MEKETKIDIVIPYVNNQDQKWRKTYLDYAQKHGYYGKMASMGGARYTNEIDLIYYQLQLVNKNMPFINKIFLLLSNIEQIKKELLPNNVEIVLHEQFIPYKYLPTFNSCTIEMFLWNIKGLSEKFIYANDDMLPIKPLKASDFFYYNKIKMNYKSDTLLPTSTQFKKQCYNSYNVIKDIYHEKDNDKEFYYPEHTMTPMFLSDCKECFELIKDKVLPQIRAFRNDYQHNQYIYPLYECFYKGHNKSNIEFYYTHLEEDSEYLLKMLENAQIICVNYVKDLKNANILERFLRELCK